MLESARGAFVKVVWRWLWERIEYVIFKLMRLRQIRKSRKADPNVYPLW